MYEYPRGKEEPAGSNNWVTGYGTSPTYTEHYQVTDTHYVYNFDRAGYVFTGWLDGTSSGADVYSR
jgi:hypothetical protein